jgi:hypothetical protein
MLARCTTNFWGKAILIEKEMLVDKAYGYIFIQGRMVPVVLVGKDQSYFIHLRLILVGNGGFTQAFKPLFDAVGHVHHGNGV